MAGSAEAATREAELMQFTELEDVRSDHLLNVTAYPYATIGARFVELSFSSGRVLTFSSAELVDAPFETYVITIGDGPLTGAESQEPPVLQQFDVQIGRIEEFTRDEWEEPQAPAGVTVGINPVTINTGPVGTAPSETRSITTICGVAFFAPNLHGPALMITLSDYAGLLTICTDLSIICSYRETVSVKIL